MQTPDGVFFDSIVLPGRSPAVAGGQRQLRSRGHSTGLAKKESRRAGIMWRSFTRPTEWSSATRNSKPYRSSLQSNGPYEVPNRTGRVEFRVSVSSRRLVTGAVREGPAGSALRSPLSAEEVTASSGASSDFIPDSRVMAELSAEDETIAKLNVEIELMEAELGQLGNVPDQSQ